MLTEKQKENYFKEIEKIEENYLKLVGDLPLNYPKALNLPNEKQKFFKALKLGELYNPQFKYEKDFYHKSRIRALQKLYKRISLSKDYFALKKIYKDKLADIINLIQYHLFWGDVKSSKYVIKAKGQPGIFLLLKAKRFCKNYKSHKKSPRRLLVIS